MQNPEAEAQRAQKPVKLTSTGYPLLKGRIQSLHGVGLTFSNSGITATKLHIEDKKH